MPIYEYQCNACDNTFEHLARSSQSSAPACPRCGARNPKKQFSTFSAAVTAASPDRCSLGACPSGACCASGACPRE